MAVKVYFERQPVINGFRLFHEKVVAYCSEEEIYMSCFGALEKLASERGMFVTESLTHESDDPEKTE